MVGINSHSIQAIKIILTADGLTWGKVAILCGGPDWPTSVLTGILRLKLRQMLVGSLPIIFLIMPCVCAGGFLNRVSANGEETVWNSLSTVAITFATLTQGAASVAALYFIEQSAHNNYEYLLKLKKDEEVEEYERASKEKIQQWVRLTDWHSSQFPSFARVLLGVGAFCMGLSCYLVGVVGSMCFKTFQVTDKIDETLADPLPSDNCEPTCTSTPCIPLFDDKSVPVNNCAGRGNPLNIINNLGYLALLLFGLSCFILWVFGKWASWRVKNHIKRFQTVVKEQEVVNHLHHGDEAEGWGGKGELKMADVARANQLNEQLPEGHKVGDRAAHRPKRPPPKVPGVAAMKVNPTKVKGKSGTNPLAGGSTKQSPTWEKMSGNVDKVDPGDQETAKHKQKASRSKSKPKKQKGKHGSDHAGRTSHAISF
jgi:hypothetical protein